MPTDPPAGGAIRSARAELGLSRQELATLVGCSLNAVAKWERGQARPTPLYAAALRRVIALGPDGIEDARTMLAGIAGQEPNTR